MELLRVYSTTQEASRACEGCKLAQTAILEQSSEHAYGNTTLVCKGILFKLSPPVMQSKLTEEDKRKITEMGYSFPPAPSQSPEAITEAVQCRYPTGKGLPDEHNCDIAKIVYRLER